MTPSGSYGTSHVDTLCCVVCFMWAHLPFLFKRDSEVCIYLIQLLSTPYDLLSASSRCFERCKSGVKCWKYAVFSASRRTICKVLFRIVPTESEVTYSFEFLSTRGHRFFICAPARLIVLPCSYLHFKVAALVTNELQREQSYPGHCSKKFVHSECRLCTSCNVFLCSERDRQPNVLSVALMTTAYVQHMLAWATESVLM